MKTRNQHFVLPTADMASVGPEENPSSARKLEWLPIGFWRFATGKTGLPLQTSGSSRSNSDVKKRNLRPLALTWAHPVPWKSVHRFAGKGMKEQQKGKRIKAAWFNLTMFANPPTRSLDHFTNHQSGWWNVSPFGWSGSLPSAW